MEKFGSFCSNRVYLGKSQNTDLQWNTFLLLWWENDAGSLTSPVQPPQCTGTQSCPSSSLWVHQWTRLKANDTHLHHTPPPSHTRRSLSSLYALTQHSEARRGRHAAQLVGRHARVNAVVFCGGADYPERGFTSIAKMTNVFLQQGSQRTDFLHLIDWNLSLQHIHTAWTPRSLKIHKL